MGEKSTNSKTLCGKALLPMISSNYFDVGAAEESHADPLIGYDPNRRSSLGGESLLEHDLSEETVNLDDCNDSLLSEAQLGLEYADDIFMLSRYKEHLNHPQKYIEEQPQVTEYMRCTLINWLVKVNHQLHFGPETIFIAVNLTDRFLASTPVAQDCLQLLAVCALFVAAKLEEPVVPGISVLVSLCGSTYRHYHFRRMETLLLSTLQFELHSPTSWFFVTYITLKSCYLASLDRRTLNLARYVIETCLGSYCISQFFPSEQAASALVFSYLVFHAPNSVYPSLIQEDSSLNLVGENRESESIFEMLSGFSALSSSLIWTFQDIFSLEEFKKINTCFHVMKDYMKSFLYSSNSSSGSNLYTLNIFQSPKNSSYEEPKTHDYANKSNFSATYTCPVYDEKKMNIEVGKCSKRIMTCKSDQLYVNDSGEIMPDRKRSGNKMMICVEGDCHNPNLVQIGANQSVEDESNSISECIMMNREGEPLHSECNVT